MSQRIVSIHVYGGLTGVVVLWGIGEGFAIAIGIFSLGAVAAFLAVAGAVLMGLVAYVRYLGVAIRARDRAWLFDIVAAPAVSIVFSLVLYGSISTAWLTWLHALRHLDQTPESGVGWARLALGLILGCIGAVVVLGAPIAAVSAIGNDRDRRWRFVGYAAFAMTSAYWVVGADSLLHHGALTAS